MIPKKAKEFIKPTVEITGESEELVKAVIELYWSKLKKSLSDLKAPNIIVNGLGTFKLKTWKIDEYEKEQNDYLKHHKTKKRDVNFQTFAIIKELESKLEKVAKVKELIQQDVLKKEEVKRRRYGTKNNLDKPQEDTGGDDKLSIQKGVCGEDSKRET